MTTGVPFQSVIFDFDSTLTRLEGVDYLADLHGVGAAVKAMTKQAMDTYSITPVMYRQRLELIRPLETDIHTLAEAYWQELLSGAVSVIADLRSLGKQLYIVSGGLRQAILPVAEQLSIPESHVFAVDIYFNKDGSYAGFDDESPLIGVAGKSTVILSINAQSPVAFIGDGANDLSAAEIVDRFVGFGGAVYRPSIEDACDIYVRDANFRSILPGILTPDEQRQIPNISTEQGSNI